MSVGRCPCNNTSHCFEVNINIDRQGISLIYVNMTALESYVTPYYS